MGRFLVIAAGVAAAGVVALAACGGDDDSGGGSGGDQAEYVDAVSASIREDDETPVDAGQADCMGAAIVDVVGVDALRDAGVSPDELGDADDLASLDLDVAGDAADRLGAGLAECRLGDALEGALVDSFATNFGTELSEEAATCLRDNLDAGALTDGLAAAFVDGSDEHLRGPLVSAIAACPSVEAAVLLAQAPAELPPAAQACVRQFVEGNPELAAQSFASGAASDRQRLGAELAAACPEAAAAFGGG